MSDNLRRFYAIRQCLIRVYPTPPKGNLARQLTTLAALISGIVGSKSTQLPKIAEFVADDTKAESRIKKILPVSQERRHRQLGLLSAICEPVVGVGRSFGTAPASGD